MSDEQTEYTVDQLVAIYRKIRSAKQEIEERHKAELAELDEQLDMVSQQLLDICQEQNVDSLRTPSGTVSRRVWTRYWTSDWDSMYQFMQEHDAPFLLEQRIHKGNMQQFLEENPDLHPPGLQADSKYVITVRKPTGT